MKTWKEIAESAYKAYGASMENKNGWETLTPTMQKAWEAAVRQTALFILDNKPSLEEEK